MAHWILKQTQPCSSSTSVYIQYLHQYKCTKTICEWGFLWNIDLCLTFISSDKFWKEGDQIKGTGFVYRPNCRNCPPVNFQLTSPTPASCHLVSSGHPLPPSLWLKGAKHAPFQSYQPLSMMLENSHMLSTDHRTLRRWSRSSHQTVAKWLPGRHPMATWSSPNFKSFLTQLQASKNVWTRFWSWCLVDFLKMKFDQDFCWTCDTT